MEEHKNKFVWVPMMMGLTVLVLSLAVAVVKVTSEKTTQQVTTQAATEASGLMALSPASGQYTFSSSQTYPVGILVDSAGKNVDGVDVIINFDPKRAEVVGTSLSPTTLFERFLVNKIDNVTGQIKFSALSFDPKPVTGIAATFSFRPKSVGIVNFDFEFTPEVTTDSNIAENGTAKDVLGRVENGQFNFK